MKFKIKKLVSGAMLPTTQEGDVGYDLYCTELEQKENILIAKTGLSIELPKGYWAQIENRSSMGFKGVSVHGGIIDNQYRGEIMIMLNLHNKDVDIRVGDKIAQLIIRKEIKFEIEEVVGDLQDTFRGDRGFGSTGR